MSWLALALAGHLANGAAFVIDKALLTSAFRRSATYAAMIGTLSLATIVAAPWVSRWPGVELLPVVIGFGSCFVFALWAFFEALKRGEATRVVPIVGSLIPILTLLGTTSLFDERLSSRQLLGFVLLLCATWLLTRGGRTSRITKDTLGLCVLAACLFAVATLCGKYAFDRGDFLGVFIESRLAAGLAGLTIAVLIPTAGREIRSLFQRHPSIQSPAPRHATLLAIVGQTLGSMGFILVHLAIKAGSAALVNALQAIQYAFLVLAALALRKLAPRLLGESLNHRVLLLKIVALIVTGLGLALVA